MSILSLGYLRLRSPNLEQWKSYATDVLGFMPSAGPDPDAQYYRWDKYPYRLMLTAAEEPGIDAIGFEVGDDRNLDDVVQAVSKTGIAVEYGTAEEAAERLVSGFARFNDPAGAPIEIFYGPIMSHARVVTPLVSGFVTGEMGLGHVVINVPEMSAVSDFYRDVLGFHRRNTWHLGHMSMAFLGCNPRHHTLAFGAGFPMPGMMIHFMVEAATIDDVGYAQDRCVDAGVPVRMSMGKHTNDHMISFYCETPDRFMVEFGWGGVHVDEPELETTYQITKPSFWGHRPLGN